MVNGRFVMLGTDNTEKSGLISAFYQQLSDHTVFTAQSQLSSPIQYTPFAGNDEISSMHTFAMCFENNAMVRIELTDFSEQFLNTFRNDLPEYSAYVNSIHSADVVYILIDGSHFLTDSIDMCVKNLKRKNNLPILCCLQFLLFCITTHPRRLSGEDALSYILYPLST